MTHVNSVPSFIAVVLRCSASDTLQLRRWSVGSLTGALVASRTHCPGVPRREHVAAGGNLHRRDVSRSDS